MNTNIVTVRSYEDNTKLVEINGREIPDVKSMECDGRSDGTVIVKLEFIAAQVNNAIGDNEFTVVCIADRPMPDVPKSLSNKMTLLLVAANVVGLIFGVLIGATL